MKELTEENERIATVGRAGARMENNFCSPFQLDESDGIVSTEGVDLADGNDKWE